MKSIIWVLVGGLAVTVLAQTKSTPNTRKSADPVSARFAKLSDQFMKESLALSPVNASQALFEARRIPGEIIVDHQVTELQVDPLASSISGDHELSSTPELLLGGDPVLELHSAVNRAYPVAPLLQFVRQISEGVSMFGEDHEFLMR